MNRTETVINQNIDFEENPEDQSIIGQLEKGDDDEVQCTGLGREVDYGIYEGQYLMDEWNGFGRRIIANGDFFIGFWKDGMKNGWGIYVYQNSGIKAH